MGAMDDDTQHADWALIQDLGGAAAVAKLLQYDANGGVQRVQNWKVRGIPAAVKLERPDLFLPELVKATKKEAA